jgi:hypothetical protein
MLLPLIIRRVWRYQSCRDRMVVLFTFILCITSLSPQHFVCVFSIPADGEVYSIQPHNNKFVSGLQAMASTTNIVNHHDITDALSKVSINTHNSKTSMS